MLLSEHRYVGELIFNPITLMGSALYNYDLESPLETSYVRQLAICM